MKDKHDVQRNIKHDSAGWCIEETIHHDGTVSRAYYYKKQLAIRVELDSPKVKRLAGLILVEKDLRTIGAWMDALHGILVELGASEDETRRISMPTEHAKLAKVTVARGLFVAIVTTYGKLFTTAKGRGLKLDQKPWVAAEHKETHEFLMHTRHTFTAHSGEGSDEQCDIVLAADYSRRNRTYPRIFSELQQPTTVGLPELNRVRDLILHLRKQVHAKKERATAAAYEEAVAKFNPEKLFMLRKGAPGTFLRE